MKRFEIKIAGIVQGVGFRPFIYSLACRIGLTGYIANSSDGVIIQIQAHQSKTELFINSIHSQSPPLAKPEIVSVSEIDCQDNESGFEILDSQCNPERKVVISPDAAICDQCKIELLDSNNRRYRYPFINCTNCGPRYSIISDIPYDRINTTMNKFVMCEKCQSEYDNPSDRRYHAQPNACSGCGPALWLCDGDGNVIVNETNAAVNTATGYLEQGNIVAIKGLGGFHLAVRADDDEAVKKLRERKYRKAQAFAVMVKDISNASEIAIVGETEKQLLQSSASPIVLCIKKDTNIICNEVSPYSRFQGLMLPYTPLHILLMQGNYPALVMTSGNRSGEPIETDNEMAINRLGGIADYLLLHNRDIYTCCDDSVIKVFDDKPMVLRRSRGYVPTPITIKRKSDKHIIALGSDLKNTVAFAKNENIYISQHIGDVINSSANEHMNRTVEKLEALVWSNPETVCCDLHPAMMTTGFAKQHNIPLVQVQHHHAHIAAVMGEHHLDEPIIGMAADGLGFGTDETIWGCEFILASRDRFKRLGALQTIGQPGGDNAAKQPWRMGLSYLAAAYSLEEAGLMSNKFFPGIDKSDIDIVISMLDKKLNCPATSSLGRLFDAVSSLLGICMKNSYEAQAAIELEYYSDNTMESYEAILSQDANVTLIETCNLIKGIVNDISLGINIETISGKFHNWIAEASFKMINKLAKENSCYQIALAGGVFQNDILLHKLVQLLNKHKYEVYFNCQLPVNDGAISFGQAVVADATL